MNAYMLFSKAHKFDHALRYIIITVLVCHAALLILLATFSDHPPPPKPIERLIVKTISLHEPTVPQPQWPQPPALIVESTPPLPEIQETPDVISHEPEPLQPPPPPSQIKEEPKPEPVPAPMPPKEEPVKKAPVEKKEAPKKKPTPPPKREVTKPKTVEKEKKVQAAKPKKDPPKPAKPNKPVVADNKPKKKSTEVVKPKPEKKAEPAKPKVDPAAEAAKAKRRELLADAQKSIAKIDRVHDKLAATESSSTAAGIIPAQIDTLQVETLATESADTLSPREKSYYEELASRLKLLLRLPEFGEVRIKLTLDRSGKFLKVVVMSAESTKNRKYIEKTLPTLTYPSFGNNFNDQSEYTFIIALSNEL